MSYYWKSTIITQSNYIHNIELETPGAWREDAIEQIKSMYNPKKIINCIPISKNYSNNNNDNINDNINDDSDISFNTNLIMICGILILLYIFRYIIFICIAIIFIYFLYKFFKFVIKEWNND